MSRLDRALFGTHSATIPLSCSIDEAVERLSSAVLGPSPGTWLSRALSASPTIAPDLIGTVSKDRVFIARYRRFSRTQFRPTFSGRFRQVDAMPALVGEFSVATPAKILTGAVVALLLWWAISIVKEATAAGAQNAIPMVLILPAVSFLIFATIFAVGRYLTRQDAAFIRRRLEEILDTSPGA